MGVDWTGPTIVSLESLAGFPPWRRPGEGSALEARQSRVNTVLWAFFLALSVAATALLIKASGFGLPERWAAVPLVLLI